MNWLVFAGAWLLIRLLLYRLPEPAARRQPLDGWVIVQVRRPCGCRRRVFARRFGDCLALHDTPLTVRRERWWLVITRN